MNFQELITKFNHGVNWNAYLYTIYKITNTAVTFVLFQNLSTNHFTAWAAINSVVYLTILWADCGFRKSLPRYAPTFAQDKRALSRFIKSIVTFEIILLAGVIPLVLYTAVAGITKNFLVAPQNLYLIAGIFAAEGMVSIIRLLYYSYFLQKPFNLISSSVLMIEAASTILIAYTFKESDTIVYGVFLNKLIASSSIMLLGGLLFRRFYKESEYPRKDINYTETIKGFAQHSAIMWINTVLRSFSERNFLVPVLALIGGPGVASVFKVANDGALLFQRIVLKTIGTTDTSLFAHVQTLPGEKKLLEVAFKKLTSKIAALCIPLLGIIVAIVYIVFNVGNYDNYAFQLFAIMATFYILEIIFLPFERVLEVYRRYRYLVSVYCVYALCLFLLLSCIHVSWIGLIGFVMSLGFVRLVSVWYMAYIGYREYGIALPRSVFGYYGLLVFLILGIGYMGIQFAPGLSGALAHLFRSFDKPHSSPRL